MQNVNTKRIIKLFKGALGFPKVQPEKKLMRDFGEPTLRVNSSFTPPNVPLRTGMSKPQLAKRRLNDKKKFTNVPTKEYILQGSQELVEVKPSFSSAFSASNRKYKEAFGGVGSLKAF